MQPYIQSRKPKSTSIYRQTFYCENSPTSGKNNLKLLLPLFCLKANGTKKRGRESSYSTTPFTLAANTHYTTPTTLLHNPQRLNMATATTHASRHTIASLLDDTPSFFSIGFHSYRGKCESCTCMYRRATSLPRGRWTRPVTSNTLFVCCQLKVKAALLDAFNTANLK